MNEFIRDLSAIRSTLKNFREVLSLFEVYYSTNKFCEINVLPNLWPETLNILSQGLMEANMGLLKIERKLDPFDPSKEGYKV